MVDYFIFLNIIMAFTTIWIVRKYLNILFPEKVHWNWFTVGAWVLFYVFQVFVEFEKGTGSLYVLCIDIVLVSLISIVGYIGLIREKLVHIVLLHVIWMLMEIVSVYVLSFLNVNAVEFRMLGSVISKFMMIIFVDILNIGRQKGKLYSISTHNTVILLMVPASSIYLAYNLFVLGFNRDDFVLNYVVSFVLLFLINITIYELYSKLSSNVVLEKENAMFQQQLNLMPKHTKEQMKTMMDFQKAQHDFKNQLIGLRYLIEQRNIEDTLDILDELLNLCNTNMENVSNSGNKVIDAIINYKYTVAKEYNIEFQTKIFVPQEVPIRQTDLSVILGNILDNAIEAAKVCEDRFIDISIGLKNNALIMVIRNPYIKIERDRNGNLVTTKKDKKKHGFGLTSVRKAVERYNGEVIADTEGNTFVLTILMELQNG